MEWLLNFKRIASTSVLAYSWVGCFRCTCLFRFASVPILELRCLNFDDMLRCAVLIGLVVCIQVVVEYATKLIDAWSGTSWRHPCGFSRGILVWRWLTCRCGWTWCLGTLHNNWRPAMLCNRAFSKQYAEKWSCAVNVTDESCYWHPI